jgi:hypothetical protein
LKRSNSVLMVSALDIAALLAGHPRPQGGQYGTDI